MKAPRLPIAAALLIATCAAFAAGPGPAPARKAPKPAPRVVILSWDGAKPEVLRTLMAQGYLEALKGLVSSGCWTWEARTIVPSLTLPAHVSMVTGVPATEHGVTWNSSQPAKGPLKVPSIFSLARAAGLKTALVVGKTKLNLLAGTEGANCQVLEKRTPAEVAEQATMILKEKNPDLLFVHFGAPDAAGHDHGWGDETSGQPPSPEYDAALCACDAATGKLLAALRASSRWRKTLVILTADHGGRGENHGGEDPQETTIPWIASGGLVAAPGQIKTPVSIMDTAATALAALGLPVPAAWLGKPVPGVLPAEDPNLELKPAA